jgi:peptidylprolyl isomerase
MKKAEHGQHVAVHYTGTLSDGEVFDTSEGRDPLKFTIGKGNVIDGFNDGVIGLAVGEEREITLAPDKAYGDRDETLVMKVDRHNFDGEEQPEVGMEVGVRMEDGHSAVALITEISAKKVTLDLNHPLAGKTLNFKIKLLELHNPGDPGTEDWDEDLEDDCCGEHDGCCDSCSDCEH